MAVRAVRLAVLGGFGVTLDGAPLQPQWPTRRSAELVQLLALAAQFRLPRDVAIDALWPRLDTEAGATQLRKAAHHARRALGDERAVVIGRGDVALFPDAVVSTDSADFTHAAEAALAAGDADTARAAAARYAGELLPGARYEEWTEPHRRRLAEQHIAVLRVAGDWADLLRADPTDEGAALAAMREALDTGRRHVAIGVYGRLAAALTHLGAAPHSTVEAMYQEAIRGLGSPRRALVGRARELAVLDDVVAAPGLATDIVAIRGPAGIGKTALLGELAGRLQRQGWAVVTVTASDVGDAYAVLVATVERLVASHTGVLEQLDPATRSVLAAFNPALGTRSDSIPTVPTRHQVVGAVQRIVETVSASRPVLIGIDDAHQADASSLDALTMLGDRELGRLIVVLVHRAEPASPSLGGALARAARRRPPVVVALDPLPPADARALAGAARPDLPTETVEALVGRADGNPFCLLELAAAGGAGDALAADVSRAIEARFVQLDDAALDAVRRLAAVGVPLDLDLTVALDCGPDALDAAIAAGVLEVRDGRYAFRHDLVREALSDRFAPHQRRMVHRRAALGLARTGARPSTVAAQWMLAGEPAEAVPWLVAAAREAARVGSFSTAIDHLDAALVADPGHADALHQRAVALDAVGDPRALAAYAAAIAAADADEVRELRPLQALAQIKMGDPAGALDTIAGAEPRTLDSRLAQALTFSGAALLGATSPERGSALSAAGRRAALAAGDPSALVVAAWSNAAAAHARGDLRESLRIDLADTSALPRLATTVFDGQLCITQRLLYGERPYDDVIAWTDAFAAEATRLGAARGVAFATTLRGEAELLSGRLAAADTDLANGRDLHRAIDAPTGESFSLQRRAEVALARGDRRRARRLLDEALAVARSSDVGFHLFDRIYGTRIALADNAGAAYDAALEAEEAVRGPLETCPGCRITLELPAGIAIARAGDLERLDRYEQTCTFLADVVMHLPAWDAALDEFRAHAAEARGDRKSAVQLFADAAAAFAAAGHPLDAARCRAAAPGYR